MNYNYPYLATTPSKREQLISDMTLFASSGDCALVEDKYQLFITAHFGKRNQVDAEHNCKHFRNVIDRKFLRSKKRLFKVLSLERGSESYNETHAHWLFEAPRHISKNCFESIFTDIWRKHCGSDNVQFKNVENELGGVQGLINYCTKESNYGNFGTFIEVCSDNSRRQSNRQSLQELKAIRKQENLASNVITSNVEQSAKHLFSQ